MVINTEMQNFSENIGQNFGHMETMSTQFHFSDKVVCDQNLTGVL